MWGERFTKVQHIMDTQGNPDDDVVYRTLCGMEHPTLRNFPKRPWCRTCMDKFLERQDEYIDVLHHRLSAVGHAVSKELQVNFVATNDGGGMAFFRPTTKDDPQRLLLPKRKAKDAEEDD